MAIQIGDEPERISLTEKLSPWIRRVLIGGCLVWVCFSIQNFSEDTRSHTIKITYPLLLNYEKITRPGPGFDTEKAVWKPVATGFKVADGAVFFVKAGSSIYAVTMDHQTTKPEQAGYSWLKIGGTEPIVKGTAQPLPDGVRLPGATVGWSGRSDGQGFLYLDDAFIYGRPSAYEVGVPFQSGDLEKFRKAVPGGVHFESVPWKIEDAGDMSTIPAP